MGTVLSNWMLVRSYGDPRRVGAHDKLTLCAKCYVINNKRIPGRIGLAHVNDTYWKYCNGCHVAMCGQVQIKSAYRKGLLKRDGKGADTTWQPCPPSNGILMLCHYDKLVLIHMQMATH